MDRFNPNTIHLNNMFNDDEINLTACGLESGTTMKSTDIPDECSCTCCKEARAITLQHRKELPQSVVKALERISKHFV